MRRARPLLGTLVTIEASGPTPTLTTAIDAAFSRVARLHALMSYHDPTSDVSRLNRQAGTRPIRVADDTHTVLRAALDWARRSRGSFDPCVADRLERDGTLPRRACDHRTARGQWQDIVLLDDRRVRFRRPLRIDLGGIAKGYAVDAAVAVLLDAGLSGILVNAGGDLRVAGLGSREIAVRHPLSPQGTAHVLVVSESALASSAPYFSRRRSPKGPTSALIEPRTRRPCLGEVSVSVAAPTCLAADALTKVILFAPRAVAMRCLEDAGARGYVLGAGRMGSHVTC
jgi:FAD:protein FMN transferase